LSAILLSAAVLTGGTANSSQAARKAALKNHSTKVKKAKQHTSWKQSGIASRRARVTAHSAASKGSSASSEQSRLKAENEPQKAVAGYQDSDVAGTPRAAAENSEDTRKSSNAGQAAADAAVLEALARRKNWTDPRSSLVNPVKVKDPAGDRRTEPVVAAARPKAVPSTSNRSEIRTIRASEPVQRTTNEDLIREALRNRGARYVWGGASRGGFDCSGFMCYIFARQRGVKLPHSASAQARLGSPVSSSSLQPGDLVFFSTYRPGISHVGMYLGDGRFIHAANSRRDVRIDTLTEGYYAHRLKAARRITSDPLRLTPAEIRAITQDASVLPLGNEP
jgi:cell wall-associated NlpC family hydrolase